MKRRPRLAALAMVLAVAGCGYGLRGTLPADIRTVAVPIFTNRTPQPAIEAVVTRAMAKNPADRWQTASDFARALGSAEDQIRLGVISGSQTPVSG